MMRSMKEMAAVLSVAMMGMAGSASAGVKYEAAHCFKNTDGSGYCDGNLLGFRAHPNTGTFAWFRKNSVGLRQFYARFPVGGTLDAFSCTPDASVTALWSTAINHHGYFYISWNADGTCTYLRLVNGSSFKNF